MASALAKKLGIPHALAFDLNAACAGWLYGLEVGRAFIRAGTPADAGLPAWPCYEPGRRATMLLDLESRVVDDPDGALRELWPA